jgi:hypothetical protein
MVGLPINFAIPNEQSIASYSWTDIADGTGYIDFEGFKEAKSASSSYVLSTNAISTTAIASGDSGSGATTTLTFYCSAFNTPRTVGGTAIFYALMSTRALDAIGAGGSQYLVVKFYKLSGVTSTQIGSTATSETNTVARNTWTVKPVVMNITLPDTNFKVGDQLYVEVINTSGFATGGANFANVYHDPLNRVASYSGTDDADSNFTQLKISVPFRIDL